MSDAALMTPLDPSRIPHHLTLHRLFHVITACWHPNGRGVEKRRHTLTGKEAAPDTQPRWTCCRCGRHKVEYPQYE